MLLVMTIHFLAMVLDLSKIIGTHRVQSLENTLTKRNPENPGSDKKDFTKLRPMVRFPD